MITFSIKACLFRALPLLVLACSVRAGAMPGPDYLDSIYTYTYLKHRVYRCAQQFRVPKAELRRLQAAGSIADSLARRWPYGSESRYSYLPYWAKHPEIDEDSAMARFGIARPAAGSCITDTSGYATTQRRLTAWRLSAHQKKQSGDTLSAISDLDSITRHFPHNTNALGHAKRLAISSRDTATYLRLLSYSAYNSFNERRQQDAKWPMANTPEKAAFVQACFRLADSNAMPAVRQEAPEVRLCINRYADLQSISSDCVFTPRSALQVLLKPNKQALRRIYCFLTEESYTTVPAVFCRYINDQDSISPASFSALDYLTLHLIQLNAYGRIYPDSLFDNYFRFLLELVYAQRYDMETYASFWDEYRTAVKGLPSEYGYTARSRLMDLHYGTAPSAAVNERRKAAHLLPLNVASQE